MGTKGIIIIILLFWIGITTLLFSAARRLEKNTEAKIALLENKIKAEEEILSHVFQQKFNINKLRTAEVKVHAYNSEVRQCDKNPHETSTGLIVSPNCVAVSRDLPIPKFKHILAVGIGTLRNEDTMGESNKKSLDIWMPDRIAAKAFGVKEKVKIMWLDDE